jgi:hypothetical protein
MIGYLQKGKVRWLISRSKFLRLVPFILLLPLHFSVNIPVTFNTRLLLQP